MTDRSLHEVLTELCDEADRRRSITGQVDKESWGNGDLTTAQVRAALEAAVPFLQGASTPDAATEAPTPPPTEQHIGDVPGCTGRTADWCPIHGNCECDPNLGLDEPTCPLHGTLATHPLPSTMFRTTDFDDSTDEELTTKAASPLALHRERVLKAIREVRSPAGGRFPKAWAEDAADAVLAAAIDLDAEMTVDRVVRWLEPYGKNLFGKRQWVEIGPSKAREFLASLRDLAGGEDDA